MIIRKLTHRWFKSKPLFGITLPNSSTLVFIPGLLYMDKWLWFKVANPPTWFETEVTNRLMWLFFIVKYPSSVGETWRNHHLVIHGQYLISRWTICLANTQVYMMVQQGSPQYQQSSIQHFRTNPCQFRWHVGSHIRWSHCCLSHQVTLQNMPEYEGDMRSREAEIHQFFPPFCGNEVGTTEMMVGWWIFPLRKWFNFYNSEFTHV